MIIPFQKDEVLLDDIRTADSVKEGFHLWWLGQSGFLLKWHDRHLLFDPYLSDSLTAKYAGTGREHVRLTERCIDPALLRMVDVVTSSHHHTDHLDAATLIPLAADRLAATGRYAAVLCLGAIIRGETSHDRHIASAVGHGIEQAARSHGLPVLFGVLTCDTLAQALARAGGDAASQFAGNKGRECAAAAIEMISLLDQLPPRQEGLPA
jgi:6,7-dimethyl-8-ribityllumazine synthase